MKNEVIVNWTDVVYIFCSKILWVMRMRNAPKQFHTFDDVTSLDIISAITDVFNDMMQYVRVDENKKSYMHIDFDDLLSHYSKSIFDARNCGKYDSQDVADALFTFIYDVNELIDAKTINVTEGFVKPMDEDKAKYFNGLLGDSGFDFKNGDMYLSYRGLELPLDDYGDAIRLDDCDKRFQLEWDWWYPIDRYIFLERDIYEKEKD